MSVPVTSGYAGISMVLNVQIELSPRAAIWVDSLAGHAEVADPIAARGEDVVPPLAACLAGDPQARCFAVAMLARFAADGATLALRALRVRSLRARLERGVARHALAAEHPTVRAVAALLAWRGRYDPVVTEALPRGAVGCDRDLADLCRDALEQVGPDLPEPARQGVLRNAEPNVYGALHPLSAAQRDWPGWRLRA
ncbi:MAG: hypothetical protein ACREPL_14205 [Rhodanobacteraceae bacterium]